jgi:hypothetical protein
MTEKRIHKRQRDELYLRYLRRQCCCVCQDVTGVDAYHSVVNTTNGPDRCSDRWALPLCGRHQRIARTVPDGLFWKSYGIDPLSLALRYHASPDDDPLIIALKARGQL